MKQFPALPPPFLERINQPLQPLPAAAASLDFPSPLSNPRLVTITPLSPNPVFLKSTPTTISSLPSVLVTFSSS
ncbi:hypothetical protein GQ457_02G015460 [Hibiscus cannabinus]